MDPWAHIYAKHKTYITSRVQSWNSPHTQTRGKKRFCQKSCELKSLRAPWRHTTQTHLGVHTHIHAPTHLQTCYAKAFFTNFNKKSCLIYTLCHLHDLFRSQLFVRRASSSFIRESARECACERGGDGWGWISVEREREGHIKLYDRHQMGSSYQKYAAMHINFRNQISKSDTEKGERERGEKMK